MNITVTCPGCTAALSLSDTEKSTTCQYCGTHFEVNLDETNPTLRKTEPADQPVSETYVPSQEDVISPPAGQTSASGGNFYNPPISSQSPDSQSDVYNPPVSGQAPTDPSSLYNPPISSSGQAYTPPPFGQTTVIPTSPTSRISGRGLWITIGITALVVFCISCLCLVAIFRGFGN
jgi:hypothetical protein